MPFRGEKGKASLVLWLVPPLLAGAGYALWGHGLVRGMYEQTLPLAALNQVFKRQALHPLSYYLAKADQAVWGLLFLYLVAGGLAWGGAWLRRRWPGVLAAQPLWGLMLLATGCYGLLFLLQIPLFQLLPHWFWSLELTPLPWWWLGLPLLPLAAWLVFAVLGQPGRVGRNLLLLILGGYLLQHDLAWMEGRGMAGLSDRLGGEGGHGRLVQAAVSQPSAWRVLTQYEGLLASGELGPFPHATRPPGQLLFLMGMDRLAGWLDPSAPDPAQRLARLAAWVFPLLGCLVLVPLFYLCRLYLGETAAWIPVLLYLVVPSTALITLHLDQCLFPLVAWSCVGLYAWALRRDRALAALGAGVIFYIGLFLSFGLVALGGVLGGLHLQAAREAGRSRWCVAALAGAGFLGLALVFQGGFDYDLLVSYSRALAAHQHFKVGDWGPGEVFYCALLNLVEYGVWCGPPLVLLCGAQLRVLSARWREWSWGAEESWALALVLTVGGLALFGRTAGETARLWLFLLPLVLVVAAQFLARMAPPGRERAVALVVVLQLLVVLVLKRGQDFF